MPRRILILDDESDVKTAIANTLEQYGFKLDSYEYPLAALDDFKPHYHDLVILDIKMPKMNGFSFYREIKKLDKDLKICFLTAEKCITVCVKRKWQFSLVYIHLVTFTPASDLLMTLVTMLGKMYQFSVILVKTA